MVNYNGLVERPTKLKRKEMTILFLINSLTLIAIMALLLECSKDK